MAEPPGGGTTLGSVVDSSHLIHIERVADVSDLASLLPTDAHIAAIQVSELLVGALLANSAGRRLRRERFLEGVLSRVIVIPFTEVEAREHARLFVAMRRAGTPIGERDLQIAATALVHGHTVLTRNVREFALVPGLSVLSPG